MQLGSDFASRIVNQMQKLDHRIFLNDELNIVYVEGINPDGTTNTDKPNLWNDLRLVIRVDDRPKIIGAWRATTEPGDRYTNRPMNPKGAARIAFGQYKAWQIGIHGQSEPHEALVQTGGAVTVHRDLNKDFIRTGDKTDTGYFGINQHWGGDASVVGAWSAGCLVGRDRLGHREFMRIIKEDSRYLANPKYVFWSVILNGSKI